MRVVCLCVLAAQLAAAQPPRIAVIDFFGVRRVSQVRLLQALGAATGDPLPASKEAAEDRLAEVDGVVLASLEAVCCEADGAVLFVGIEEKGAPHFDFRRAPAGAFTLPDSLVESYQEFLVRYEQSTRSGEDREDLTRGYALSADPVVHGYQERFAEFAGKNFALLRQVMLESSDAGHRAIAVYAIAYAADKQAAADALQNALLDPAPPVRRTALGALNALAVYASRHPEANLRLSSTWAVEMLNSIVWADRVRAVDLLVTLTDGKDARVLQQITERALVSLVEMARWKSLRHALPAYILAGRMVGLSEERIRESWDAGERGAVFSRLPASDKQAGEQR